MQNRLIKKTAYALILLLISCGTGMALEIKTRYATIIYNQEEDLHRFNEAFYLGEYSYLLKKDGIRSVTDEVKFKTDLMVEKVKSTLDMFPENLKFRIAVCASEKGVQKAYKQIYGKTADHAAFYAPEINMVFFSVSDMELATVVHEFAHIVMNGYFDVSPPVKIHELLSRYAARHITSPRLFF